MAQSKREQERQLTISVTEQVLMAAQELGARRHLPVSQVIAEVVLAERRRMLEREMREGYREMAEENLSLAEQAVAVDNETWPDATAGRAQR